MNRGMRTERNRKELAMRFAGGGVAAPAGGVESAAAGTVTGTPGAASEAAGAAAGPAAQEGEKTFTRDELNRAVAAEKARAVEAYKARMEREQAEAGRLAGMSADERLAHAQRQAQEAVEELNAYKRRAEAQRIAAEAGLPASFLEPVDFRRATDGEVGELIGRMAKDYRASVEAALNERLRQSPPRTQTGAAAPGTLKDAIAAALRG